MKSSEDLKKIYLVNTLLSGASNNDLFLAEQIKAAVDAALAESGKTGGAGDIDAFIHAVTGLKNKTRCEGGDFYCWDAAARGEAYSPLWARSELIDILKRIGEESRATLVVANLAATVKGKSRRWTPKTRAEYGEAAGFIRELACRRIPRTARLTVLVF